MHVRLADESVCIGPPAPRESYLSMAALVSAASVAGADAIHPGLGFLAENATFAQVVTDHGFTFIGPSPEHIATMGDKIAAKAAMIGGRHRPCPRQRCRGGGRSGGRPDRRRDRLSGAGEGGSGRRRARHADCPRARGPRPRARAGAARGGRRVRRFAGVHREIRREPAPYRGPGAGGLARQRRSSRRARLFHPAPPPESDRRIALSCLWTMRQRGGDRCAGCERPSGGSAISAWARWSSCSTGATSTSSR